MVLDSIRLAGKLPQFKIFTSRQYPAVKKLDKLCSFAVPHQGKNFHTRRLARALGREKISEECSDLHPTPVPCHPPVQTFVWTPEVSVISASRELEPWENLSPWNPSPTGTFSVGWVESSSLETPFKIFLSARGCGVGGCLYRTVFLFFCRCDVSDLLLCCSYGDRHGDGSVFARSETEAASCQIRALAQN